MAILEVPDSAGAPGAGWCPQSMIEALAWTDRSTSCSEEPEHGDGDSSQHRGEEGGGQAGAAHDTLVETVVGVCIDMCMDMCMDICMDMRMDMFVGMCVDKCIDL